jgi:hypothetical protein
LERKGKETKTMKQLKLIRLSTVLAASTGIVFFVFAGAAAEPELIPRVVL